MSQKILGFGMLLFVLDDKYMGDLQVAVRGKASHHALLMWLPPWGWVVVYGMTNWKQTPDPHAICTDLFVPILSSL